MKLSAILKILELAVTWGFGAAFLFVLFLAFYYMGAKSCQ